jgi:Tfp pilus assembly protein PilF
MEDGGWRAAKGSCGPVLVLFALGLMSKSMLVTLPCVLLLLDLWPLNRFSEPTLKKAGKLILEKIPLFLLSLIFCAVTMQAQQAVVESGRHIPPHIRLLNTISSFGVYIAQLFRPVNLAPFYPYPTRLDLYHVVKILLLLILISWFVCLQRKKRPFLLVGWLWYLGMLVPVIGWMQVGLQAHADRYTYLPHIGLLLMLVWLIPAHWMERILSRRIVAALFVFILLTLAVLSYKQTSVWKNTRSLWEHTLNCTTSNDVACDGLAEEFERQGQLDRSVELTEQAIMYDPDPVYYIHLGSLFMKKERPDEALKQFEKVLGIDPDHAEALCMKGDVFLRQNRIEEAFACYRQAMDKNPGNARIPAKIGMELLKQEKTEEAVPYYERAAQLQPDSAEAQVAIGGLLAALGKPEQAEAYFIKALKLDPEQPAVYTYIGNGFLRMKQYPEAVKFFKQALTYKSDFLPAQQGLQKAQAGLPQQETPAVPAQ